MKRIFERITMLGIHHSLEPRRIRGIRLLNRSSLLITVYLIFRFTSLMYTENYRLLVYYLPPFLVFSIVIPLLHHRRLYRLALHCAFTMGNLGVFVIGYLVFGGGFENGAYILFFPLAVLPTMLFLERERFSRSFWTVANVVLFAIYMFLIFEHPRETLFDEKLSFLMRVIFFAMSYGLFFYLIRGFLAVNKEYEMELQNKTELIKKEKARSDRLLLNVLPASLAEELKTQGEVKPLYYENVSVLFADLVGFTRFAETKPVEELLEELNGLFHQFDMIAEKFGLEKIKTIGDAYMAAAGVPEPSATHSIDICLAALEMRAFIKQTDQLKKLSDGSEFLSIRIGLHCGPVMAGVIGKSKFAYDIFGDTVNLASRCETAASPDEILLSEHAYQQIEKFFECESRGQVDIKNRSSVNMFSLKGIRSELSLGGNGFIPNDHFLTQRDRCTI